LEFINSIITLNLQKNTNLVYVLLQHKNTFENLSKIERFSVLGSNIVNLVSHVETQIEQANLELPSVEVLLQIVKQAVLTFSFNKITLLEPVKFTLAPDSNAAQYFTPILVKEVETLLAQKW
jgi:hypothetical protein